MSSFETVYSNLPVGCYASYKDENSDDEMAATAQKTANVVDLMVRESPNQTSLLRFSDAKKLEIKITQLKQEGFKEWVPSFPPKYQDHFPAPFKWGPPPSFLLKNQPT
jgi:hypothetical protein